MAFSPVKTAKRIGIGLESFVDGASSHFTSVGKLLLGTSLGGVLGGHDRVWHYVTNGR